jgi:hypothetical protein
MAVSIKEILGAIATVDGGDVLFKCAKSDNSEITLAIPFQYIMPMIEACSGALSKARRGQIIGETRDIPVFDVSRYSIGKSVGTEGITMTFHFGEREGELNFQMDLQIAAEICKTLSSTLASIAQPPHGSLN